MNAKTTIRKILFVALWLCIGGCMVTLLLAAISKKNNGKCTDYEIVIEGAKNNHFIDKKDVEELLFKATKGPIKGDPVISFDLYELELMLEKNNWIGEADMYFDNKDVLHVTVNEKEPVARVFSTEGNSFYINDNGRKMPLSDKLSARVPVFTGYVEKKKMNAADSLLLKHVTGVANYIINDPFWMSQVVQIDITNDGTFEMVPLVGNHIVKLGNGENIEKKFNRLMVFYKQVLSKTGFDKYKVIDVQYKEQVVVSKSAGDPKVDSIQLRRNVEKLLKQSEEAEKETAVKVVPVIKLEKDSAISNDPALKDIITNNPEKNSSPNPLKSSLAKPDEKKTEKQGQANEAKPKTEKRKPKAVMPPKVPDEEKKVTEQTEDYKGYN